MSKALKALERIKLVYQCTDMAIIEKELKRLEELDNGPYITIHINRYMELCDKEDAFDALSKDDEKAKKLLSLEIEKNRALEIIKKLNKESHNNVIYLITKSTEEANLLMEVLNA